MCGIAGYFGDLRIDSARIDATLRLMGRRGPDHARAMHFVNPAGRQVDLLHSRLSILDLDPRSNQPFHRAPWWVVLNGEVYNYVELRAQLAARGFVALTTSDTEVLAGALAGIGPLETLERAEGMWAFAAYEEEAGSLLLCRDRFGEKPLYLHRDEHGLYFGSEVKFLAALAGKRFEVDIDQLRRYLVNGYKALYKRPRGFFRGVEEVPPATALRIDAAGERATRYWTLRCEPRKDMTRQEAVDGTRERLIRSVELRLRADVPLAFCMSGGVDSNSLIAIAKRVLGYDVHGFTIVNTDARYEESELVEHAVQALDLRHSSVPTDTGDFLTRLRFLVRQHDAPVYTITYYAHWLLMHSISREGYRVSVSGTAADELFSGYFDHHLLYLREVRGLPDLHAEALAAWTKHIKPVVRNPHLSKPRLFIDEPSFRDHIFLDADRFGACLTVPWQEPFEEASYTPHLLQNRMLNELFHESVPVILHEDDLNAMYYSIENRSPFLDRALAEFAFTIPARHLVNDGAAKSVLRDAMRGIVPDPILDSRRKVGFNAPIHAFLDVAAPEVRRSLLAPSPVWDIVRRESIVDLLDKAMLPNSQSKFLFYFVCAKLFLEEFAA